MRCHNERAYLISSRKIVGIHFFTKGMIPFKVDMKGTQGLNGGLLTPAHRRAMHHVVIEPLRVLQKKEVSLIKQSHLLPLPFAPTR
jgi:hypothetical protein